MRQVFILGLAILSLGGVLFAQDPAPRGNSPTTQPSAQAPQAPGQAANTPRIAPGSVIPVELTKTIDAKKAKSGDPVEAKVTQDLKTNNGDVLVPKDTKVVGRVTGAQARTKDQKESQVAIAFDHAVMKNGDVPLPLSIQAIISPNALNGGNNNANSSGPAPAATAPSSSGVAPNTGGRSGTSAGSMPSEAPSSTSQVPAASDPNTPNNTPQITGKTEGVIGISNLNLSSSSQNGQGSVLTSEKNNVKLESGTLMLLRVNQ
jgi:hypothetical protein